MSRGDPLLVAPPPYFHLHLPARGGGGLSFMLMPSIIFCSLPASHSAPEQVTCFECQVAKIIADAAISSPPKLLFDCTVLLHTEGGGSWCWQQEESTSPLELALRSATFTLLPKYLQRERTQTTSYLPPGKQNRELPHRMSAVAAVLSKMIENN